MMASPIKKSRSETQDVAITIDSRSKGTTTGPPPKIRVPDWKRVVDRFSVRMRLL